MRGGGGDVRAASKKVSSKTAAANADDHANAFTETISDLGAINRTREVVDAESIASSVGNAVREERRR